MKLLIKYVIVVVLRKISYVLTIISIFHAPGHLLLLKSLEIAPKYYSQKAFPTKRFHHRKIHPLNCFSRGPAPPPNKTLFDILPLSILLLLIPTTRKKRRTETRRTRARAHTYIEGGKRAICPRLASRKGERKRIASLTPRRACSIVSIRRAV